VGVFDNFGCGSQLPVLALEDMDAGFGSVSCTETEINLEFVSTAAEESFRSAIAETHEFVAVTSHAGCDSGVTALHIGSFIT
jgi:hypothetical protein